MKIRLLDAAVQDLIEGFDFYENQEIMQLLETWAAFYVRKTITSRYFRWI